MSLKGIFSLWEIENYQDCWVLYRSLQDRFFHINHLNENNLFKEFSDWSFYEQMKSHNLMKSDLDFKGTFEDIALNNSSKNKDRYKYLSKNKPSWRRPKARDVAKEMDMGFLYKFGYDLASAHVHPMANDGQEDFHTITKIPPIHKFPSHITVINNSILICTMIIQEAMNGSSFKWRRVLWDYIDQIRSFLDVGSNDYQLTFIKLAKSHQELGLCEEAGVI